MIENKKKISKVLIYLLLFVWALIVLFPFSSYSPQDTL